MNNESINFTKIITTVSNTSASANNCSNTIIKSSSTSATQFSSLSSSFSISTSSQQPLSPSAQFDVTVNAIAAVVNASNNLPVTTPPKAAAVVAVAVSSLAAAFIPDTPIVSIAGSTLSEITTTTTSTKTTPTPFPTSKETADRSNNNSSASNTNITRNLNENVQNKTSPSSSATPTVNPSSSSYSTAKASVKVLAPMSVANSSATGALTNASTTAANAGAAEIKNNTNSNKQIKEISTGNSAKGSCGTLCTKSDSLAITTDIKSIITTSPSQHVVENTKVTPSKTDDNNVTPNKTKSKDPVSESWEESRLKDWDDSKLKELLDEAYSYKNPRDKENKSKTFLQLLEKAENEDQSYPFCVTSRGARNLSNTITSSSYHHYTQNSHYQSHSHNHNRSHHHHHHHHHHKQGGSLQDLFEIGLHESPLDCDQTFGVGISGNQRLRRQNHNSRQKKYSTSVSSRQREGGSLPSNVNVTHQLNLGGSGVGGVVNDISLLQQDTSANKTNKKEQRRNAATKAAAATTSTATNCSEIKENYTNAAAEETVVTNKTTTSTTTHPTYTASGGDVIIDMGEPMMDIQQQQKILQSRGQDAANQGQSFYERLANNDKRIPRANIIGSTKATYFAPTASHCYVDETVRFNALERNGNNNAPPPSTIDAKFLPLDENYKSCKSVLGSEGDKSPELLNKTKTNTIYTKISTPASGSAILTGTTTNNIATLTQRQLDENGNALSEIYQNSSSAVTGTPATIQINAVSPTNANNTAAALLNSCGNVSTSATVTISPHTASTTVSTSATVTTTFTSGPSQAKAKAKKKSQQERNTKTVDLEKVAGYRGKDPVEELVKYIESSGEDKQTVSKSSGDKKKERKKDKEKHQKLKKSNSLEELRSGAKMEVHELKRTAATTESNAVLVRQKSSGGGGGGGKKNNSSSTAEINKNLDSSSSSSRNTTNPRKSERRSWGNEDLKYLEDQQNANLLNEEKTTATGNPIKEKKNKIGGSVAAVAAAGLIVTSSKEEKEIKDKTNERNERNLANSQLNSLAAIQTDKIDKLEKAEKLEKMEKSEKPDKPDKLEKSERFEKLENKLEKRKKQTDIPPNAVTVVDILAIESVLPETAEFHVVTKKKKPKKQKVINNLEETTVTFNRTHNFTMQKTATFNQQQQQMTVRYKYYHHDNAANNNNTGISTTNPQNANNSQHNQQTNNQSQQHQQHQQSQQNQTTPSENYNTTTTTSDKSRRKSTSSVPPSEKSDSSDLDSVHSLPIEATTKGNLTNANANSHKLKPQTRTKPMNRNSNNLMGKTLPVPVSYADIARTNKEIADAAANMSSASVILINNNEISLESRNADASLNANEANTSCEEKLLLTAGNTPLTTTPQVATNLNAANLKTHKAKKSQIKQDFPELSSSSCSANNNNDDQKQLSTSNNPKTTIITYSQSLTAVQNNNQTNQNPLAGNNCAANDALQQHSSNVIEHNTKVSPMEQQKNLIVHQHINIPPTQHAQQQILQKSKSVENDTNISSTTAITATPSASLSSNASASYLASLNSNNLDQQYPTLEKTFKRHSSTNVTITATQNNSQQTPFNFAAAAKQQINMNNSNNNNNSNNEQHNINLNKNSNLTTSNTNNSNNNNTNQTALLAANKKSKEKTPPLTTTAITQQITASENAQVTTTTAAAVTAQTNPKKAKKERLQQLQQQPQTFVDQAKQSQNNTLTAAHKKPVKNPLKTSNSLPLGFNSSTNASSSLQNRPAVIILNDYRNSGGICAADNQFTFGDFNEEELKLFDDDHHNTNVGGNEDTAENMQDINLNQSAEEEKKQQSMTKSEANFKSPTTNTYFNDSGTSCGNEMLLSSSIDASSPNTSFNNNSSIALANSNCAGGALHLPAHNNNNNNNNQSSDSGIYVDKIKPSNSSLLCKSTSSSNSCSQGNINQQLTPNEKEENDKLNSFLSKTRCASNHSSMDNLAQVTPPPPPPQQLETCNDIETAIIAAARAAAKQQHQPSQQQQQQQVKSSNDSSNSSSFSSSSLTTKASTAYQQTHLHHQQQQQQPTLPPPQHHQQFSHSINSNKYGRGAVNHMSSYHHQTSSSQQQQYDEDYVMNNDGEYDDCVSNNTPRSRSPSRPRRISIAGGTVANKEFDIHFIPPSTMPTAFTTQQHNDIIVDFIGSAWEEVANSKVTKVYDGQ